MTVIKVGDIFEQRSYGKCIVIEYNSCDNVVVEFINTGYLATATAGSLRKGLVKDYLKPTVYGVGFNSYGKLPIKGEDVVLDRARVKWKDMMTRCYGPKSNYNSYKCCEVSPEWHDFKVFLDWYRSKVINDKYLDYHLDKDLMKPNSKLYSEDTCLLLPRKINNLLYQVKKKDKGTCVGVWKTSTGCFQAYTNDENSKRINLGEYRTEDEAFNVFKLKKEEVINKVVLQYKDELERNVIDLLLNLKVCKENGYYSVIGENIE